MKLDELWEDRVPLACERNGRSMGAYWQSIRQPYLVATWWPWVDGTLTLGVHFNVRDDDGERCFAFGLIVVAFTFGWDAPELPTRWTRWKERRAVRAAERLLEDEAAPDRRWSGWP